ncbi:MAG: hypothetical protein CR972_03540 [Candidatus Moraniibacteriota bacterium]|nr:MAG: hypothetical protein CR972_03540 [Candidatus Moranbacteria bacterium]
MSTHFIKRQHIAFFGSIMLSLIYVVFLWRFWSYGTQAVGLNFAVFNCLVLVFFIALQWNKLRQASFLWITPLFFISFSLFAHTTSFTTMISTIIFPLLFFVFTTHESHAGVQRNLWSRFLPITMIIIFGHYCAAIFTSLRRQGDVDTYKKSHVKISDSKKSMLFQVFAGLFILISISLIFIVPLLSSADKSFAQIFSHFFTYFSDFIEVLIDFFENFSVTTLQKMLSFIFFMLIFLGFSAYWKKEIKEIFTVSKKKTAYKNTITLGIVLVGILCLYVLFIFLQIKSLFISALPVDFSQTENLVKSGFWQLFALTIFNIILYSAVFQKSTKWIQCILAAFTVSSLFLVFSAGQRVFLYVATYGLSYEKFFALYTVIYCSIVFIWFVTLFIGKNEKVYIVKTLAFLALGMYAFSVTLPLEKIIFTTNLGLTQKEDSRVNINELRMLGFDALPVVEENYDLLIAEARKDFAQKNPRKFMILETHNGAMEKYITEMVEKRWIEWMKEHDVQQNVAFKRPYDLHQYLKSKEKECATCVQKKWYEKTWLELQYAPKIPKEKMKKQQTKKGVRTWKDPLHGFSVQYAHNTRFDAGDSYNITDLTEHDYWLTVSTDVVGHAGRSVYFTVYNGSDPDPSENHIAYTKMLRTYQRNGGPHIYLPHMPNTPAYIIVYHGKNPQERYYGLLFDLGNGNVGRISSNDSASYVPHIQRISADKYVQLITPHPELADVITSFQPIDIVE